MKKLIILIVFVLLSNNCIIKAKDFKDDSKLNINVYDYRDYNTLKDDLMRLSQEERNIFWTNLDFNGHNYFLNLRDKSFREEKNLERKLLAMQRSNSIYEMDGFQSGAFKEEENVQVNKEYKYIYEDDKLLWSGPQNKVSERLEIKSNKVNLWIPHWGSYMGERVGLNIELKRLHTDMGKIFLFASMEKANWLYTENGKQVQVDIQYFKNVDETNKMVNGEVLNLKTKYEYLLYGAYGLTNEKHLFDSIEYVAPLDEKLNVYSGLDSQYRQQSIENGHSVYYSNKAGLNADYVFNVKDKDKISLIVGIKGNEDYKTGGDSTIKFLVGFNAYNLVPQAHLLTIDPNGGSYEGERVVEGVKDTCVQIKGAFKKGYTLIDWQADYGKYQNNNYYFADHDATIKAEWQLNNYKINYILNGGVNNSNNPSIYTIESEIKLQPATKDGFNFIGWVEGNYIPLGSEGEKNFTAEWDILHYPIKYNLMGGTNNVDNPSSYTILDEINILDPIREGYRFKGWLEGNSIKRGSTGAKEFTASWEKEIYPITYDLADDEIDIATNKDNPKSYQYGEEIKLKNPIRNNYIFKGWLEGDVIKKGSRGAKHFSASWEKKIIASPATKKVVSCKEAYGPSYYWNNLEKACLYKVVNTKTDNHYANIVV